MTLAMFDGRPAYWFRLGRSRTIVYADNGEVRNEFPSRSESAHRRRWTGQPAAAAKAEVITSEDQWTVGGVYNNYAPLTKYSWPDGEEVYVSGVTGEVVQYTTRMSRLGAWLGPIPHWLYFTPLRKKPRLWSRIVIWLSGAATVVAILGLFAGLSMYSPAKRYRAGGIPTSIPYAGPKRLHMILGLFFGLLACTWAFSGMLSMDPFPGEESRVVRRPRRGFPRRSMASRFHSKRSQAKHPREALAEVGPDLKVKKLEFTDRCGRAVLSRDAGFTITPASSR